MATPFIRSLSIDFKIPNSLTNHTKKSQIDIDCNIVPIRSLNAIQELKKQLDGV